MKTTGMSGNSFRRKRIYLRNSGRARSHSRLSTSKSMLIQTSKTMRKANDIDITPHLIKNPISFNSDFLTENHS